ncbi:MAG: hypothetical protein LBJ35_02150, partial [Spirochaetaceae bacterium]|nr:hypothetical protein [Spirochaetaceae bacterium]
MRNSGAQRASVLLRYAPAYRKPPSLRVFTPIKAIGIRARQRASIRYAAASRKSLIQQGQGVCATRKLLKQNAAHFATPATYG